MSYLTPSQLATRWGCSVRKVNRLAQDRQIPALKVGRAWRIAESAVAAYEAANTTSAETVQPTPAVSVVTIRPHYQPAEMDGELPPRWWESTADNAASPAAARGRATSTKKAAVRSN